MDRSGAERRHADSPEARSAAGPRRAVAQRSDPTGRRRWIIAAMWIAALAGAGAIYLVFEPPRQDPLEVDADEAPIREAGADRAPREARGELPVEEEQGSPALDRGGRRRTGRSPFRGPARPERRWRYAAGGRVTAQAVVGEDGRIYVGDHSRTLHALSAAGERLWTARTFGPVWSSAAVVDDVVYFGSDADAFFALGAAEGASRWRLHAEGDVDGSVAIAPDGSLRFAGGRDLYCVSPSGEVRWRFRARRPFLLSTPAIDQDGTAYIGSMDHRMYAVAADGRMRWEHRTQGEISSSPVIGDDGTIYFGSDDEHVYALSRDGERLWRRDLDGFVRAPVALGRDGSILAGVYGPEPRVVSLDAETGEPRWYFPVGFDQPAEVGIASGPLVDADGNIYFGAQDDYIYSLTPRGRLRWIHQVGGDVDAPPILTPEGLLLVGSDDGFLYAIGEAEETAADAGMPVR